MKDQKKKHNQQSIYQKFHYKIHTEIHHTLSWIRDFFVSRELMTPAFAEKFFIGFLLPFFDLLFTMFLLVIAVLLYINFAPKIMQYMHEINKKIKKKRDTD